MENSKTNKVKVPILNSDLIKPILTGLVIALITTSLNYILFINQFKVNNSDKKFDKKIQLLDETSREFYKMARNIENRVEMDYYFDIKYKKWCDSLKLSVLPYSIHTQLKKQIESEHPKETESTNKLEEYSQELNATLNIVSIFFDDVEIQNKIVNYLKYNTPDERTKLYEKCRDIYITNFKVSKENINLDEISFSVLKVYSGLYDSLIHAMAIEINR